MLLSVLLATVLLFSLSRLDQCSATDVSQMCSIATNNTDNGTVTTTVSTFMNCTLNGTSSMIGVGVCFTDPLSNVPRCHGCGEGALGCRDLSSFLEVPRVDVADTITLCEDSEDTDGMLTCPDSHPVLVAACGNLIRPCNRTFVDCKAFGIQCVATTPTIPVSAETCEWTAFGSVGELLCSDDEVLTGLCISTEQMRCGGSGYGGRGRCCLIRKPSCAVPTIWKLIDTTTCPDQTAIDAVCSVRCDTDMRFGFRNNPGMFACRGRVFTRNASFYTSSCDVTMARCPAGMVMVGFGQCLIIQGPGTYVHCVPVAHGVLDATACVTLSGDDELFCPAGYYGVAMCGPSRSHYCTGGVDTVITCCKVRLYHNLGNPCANGLVYTLAGGAGVEAPYGVSKDKSLHITAIGPVQGITSCDSALFATTSTHVVYHIDVIAERMNITIGKYNVGGYTNPAWDPPWWNDAGTLLNNPVDVGAFTDCRSVLVAERDNYIVRTVYPFVFEASIRAGLGGQSVPGTLANNSQARYATMPTINSVSYLATTRQTFVGLPAAIALVEKNPLDGKDYVSYYFGDGILPGGPVMQNVHRVVGRCYSPQQMVIYEDALLYATDYDNVSDTGLIHVIDLTTGQTSPQTGIASKSIPRGIAIDVVTGTLYYSDAINNCIYSLAIMKAAATAEVLAGTCSSTGGLDDFVPALKATFRHPLFLATSSTTLYIADRDNSRIRAIDISASCSEGFNILDNCKSCLPGYYGHPHCRLKCTIDDDCSGRATAVTNFPPNCKCTCKPHWRGKSCSYCNYGLDLRANCTACLPGFYNYPSCRTTTPSQSVSVETVSQSFRASDTMTITPPPTATQTRSMSHSSTSSPTMSVSDSLQRSLNSPSDTEWITLTLERTVSRKRTKTTTFSLSLSSFETKSRLASKDVTASKTHSRSPGPSASRTVSMSASSSGSLIMTASSSRSNCLSSSTTVTPPPTATRTESWPLIPPVVYVSFPLDVESSMFGEDGLATVIFQVEGGVFDLSRPLALQDCVKVVSSSATLQSAFQRRFEAQQWEPTLLSIRADTTDGLILTRIEYLNFTFSGVCFTGRRGPVGHVSVRVRLSNPPPLLHASLYDAAFGTAVGAGVLVWHRFYVLPALWPAHHIIRMAECDQDPSTRQRLPFYFHPARFGIENSSYQYHAGAMVTDTLFAGLPLFLHFGLCHYIAEQRSLAVLDAFALLRFPSFHVTHMLYFLYPCAMCIVALIVSQQTFTGVALLFGVIWMGAIGGFLYYVLGTKLGVTWVAKTVVEVPSGMKRHISMSGRWEDTVPGNSRRNGPLFYSFCPGKLWYGVFYMGYISALGILEGVAAGLGPSMDCTVASILSTPLVFSSLLLTLFAQPFAISLHSGITMLCGLLHLTGCILSVVGHASDNRVVRKWGAISAVSSLFLMAAFAIPPAVWTIRWLKQFIRGERTLALTAGSISPKTMEEDRSSLHDGLLLLAPPFDEELQDVRMQTPTGKLGLLLQRQDPEDPALLLLRHFGDRDSPPQRPLRATTSAATDRGEDVETLLRHFPLGSNM